MIQIKGIILLT